MNDHNGGLDNELAEFTDQLLRGEEMTGDEHLDDLGVVVRRLQRAVTAEQRPDEDAIRERMRQQLAREWSVQHPVSTNRAVRWRFTRTMRLAAAALLLVVMVGVALLAGSSDEGGGFQGTATGSEIDLLPVVVLLGMAIAAFWFVRHRRG